MTETLADTPPSPPPPPPVETGHGRRWALLATGGAIAAILLIVVLNVSPDPREASDQAVLDDIIELVPPPLNHDDLQRNAVDPNREAPMPRLEAGGWIDHVDESSGKLAQRYRFQRLDPNPPGLPANWVRMERPRAEIYLSDSRVVSLEGDWAVVHLPHRVLDSGTITGHVTIKAYDLEPGTLLDPSVGPPSLVVYTTEARFDNVLGEVRCPDKFRVETPELEAVGTVLSLLINDRGERVLPTMLVEDLEYVRVAQTSLSSGDEPEEAVPVTTPATPATPTSPAASPTTPPDDQGEEPDEEPAQHYLLTLRDDVEIREGLGRRMVTGDLLTAHFTSESRALSDVASEMSAAPGPGPEPAPASLPFQLVMTQLGVQAGPTDDGETLPTERAIAPPLREDDVYITCRGRVTLDPVTDPQTMAELPSPEDAVITLTGTPVELLDRERDARAVCDHLLYRASTERIELVSSADYPLHMQAPEASAGGDVFWIGRDEGGFAGPGWLAAPRAGAPPPRGPDGDAEVVVTWQGRVDLDFDNEAPVRDEAGDEGFGVLRGATFRGDVLAQGDDGSLAGDVLDLTLEPNDDGGTTPTRLVTTGNVRASNAEQTTWADTLDITFAKRDGVLPEPSDAGDVATPYAPTLGGDVDVEQVVATGDVQVLLNNGARVFADRLDADPATESVVLQGGNVSLAQGQMLVVRGTRIDVSRQTGRADWLGPGAARFFTEPLSTDVDRRIERTELTGPVQAMARWQGGMQFDENAGSGAGAIELTGGVHFLQEPDALRRTTFEAEEVTIELTPGEDETPDAAAIGEGRDIGRIIARGNARLSDETWDDPDRADPPRLFYLTSERVEFDERTGEALVPLPGELLVRDLRPPHDQPADDRAGFSGRGTTSFRWTDKLEMVHREGTLYDIAMVGGIEMRHLDLDDAVTTLTCERVEATVDRPTDADGNPVPTQDAGDEAVNRQLRRLMAAGDVFLRTPDRDIDCDRFDYDIDSGLAIIEADPGQMVTLISHDQPQPMLVQRAEWNLLTDEIKATSGTGGGNN